MELSWLLIFKIGMLLIAVPTGIGMFADLSWATKLRLTATLLLGVLLIGILAWPMAAPFDPFGAVLIANISQVGKIALVGLALLAGFLGYFVSWPHGRQIGILAVPAGLALWAFRSGSIAQQIVQNPQLTQRLQLFAGFKWDAIFWLVMVAAGFAGVLIAQKIRPQKARQDKGEKEPDSKSNQYLNAVICLVCTVVIALFGIELFARNFAIFDSKLGSVRAQPAIGQIAFAVLVSFLLAGFAAKKLLNCSYIVPIVGSAVVTVFSVFSYAKPNILQHVAQQWPTVFLPHAVLGILPVQMVAFGALGSIWGFWLAVRYNYWRKHEM